MCPKSLDNALTHFEMALHRLPRNGRHLVPDLVLNSYFHDVRENARAVQVLLSSDVRQRAYANARACFEARQLALLLTSDLDYDLAGAKAWVFAHRKDQESAEHAERAGLMDEPPNHLPAALFYARRFSEMQSTWNDFSPGKGALLEQASALLDRKARRPDNWAGLNIPDELERRLDAIPNPAAIKLPPVKASALLRSAYAQLSREAHPHSSRLEPDRIEGAPNGPVSFVFGDSDAAEKADLAGLLTASSLDLAMVALALRLRRE